MKHTNINWIVDATKDRLKYHNISLSKENTEILKKLLGSFGDSDFNNATEHLTIAIYKKLLSFNIPDLVAFRCSWKWSD